MKKNYFLIILISFSINAQKKLSDFHLNYDSIVNHTVQKKETIFSLSKKYGLSMNEIIKANPGIQIDKLKRRSILIIPLRKKNVVKNEVDVVVASQCEVVLRYGHCHRQSTSCDKPLSQHFLLP